jgi:hypothetical protein
MLEPVQRGIERPLLDAQQVAGHLLDSLGDRPAVHRLEGTRAQDQEIERALQDVSVVAHPPPLKLRRDGPPVSLVDSHGE